jgi:hypothetical protein
MIPGPTPPPAGVMTPEEEEILARLQQDYQDCAREERELLLSARARKPADYRCGCIGGQFEEIVKINEFNRTEREGLSLFLRGDLIRWGGITVRAKELADAQYELFAAIIRRIGL